MTNTKVLLALMINVLLLGGGLVPAHAQEVRRNDAHGDAPARIDVWSAKYTHSEARVAVVAKIAALGQAGEASLSISRFTVFEAGYVVLIRKRVGHKPRVRLAYFNHFDLEPRSCSQVNGRWANGRIRLSVARACLRGHAKRKVFVQFGIQRRSKIDRAPAVKRLELS